MEQNEFEKLGAQWEQLNEEYDGYIQAILKTFPPQPLTEEEMQKLKEMQEKLYKLETDLFETVNKPF
jgi:hypothetical protein